MPETRPTLRETRFCRRCARRPARRQRRYDPTRGSLTCPTSCSLTSWPQSYPTLTNDRQRRDRLDPGLVGAGAADDAGAGVLLRRHGAREARAGDADAELRRDRASSASPGCVIGFTWAFGGDGKYLGDLHFAFLRNIGDVVPTLGLGADRSRRWCFVAFQLTFAIITPALITGSTADRWKFGAFVAFVAIWSVVDLRPGRALGVRRATAG